MALPDRAQCLKELADAHIAILGGTGSLGRSLLACLATLDGADVTVISRDEAKQADLRLEYAGRKNIRFRLADVRDGRRVREVLDTATHIVHAAALKHVPILELDPEEAVKTNILGAVNVYRAARDLGVRRVVSISTDKAVYPINAMGLTKALQEKFGASYAAAGDSSTAFVTVRYGNVVGSRGSVVPIFLDCIERGVPVSITDPDMTRFLLAIDDAVDVVLAALVAGRSGDLLVRKAPAASIAVLADALIRMTGRPADYPRHVVGVRPGEKMHEVLLTGVEMRAAADDGRTLCVSLQPRTDDDEVSGAYSSRNAVIADVDDVAALLSSPKYHLASPTQRL